MTWRPLYVPQVGQAVWGSFGSRHWGQVTSVGRCALHFARRCRVLLRDILRFGTATSALLVLSLSVLQRRPPGVDGVVVAVFRPGVGQPRAADRAQARTVVAAQR